MVLRFSTVSPSSRGSLRASSQKVMLAIIQRLTAGAGGFIPPPPVTRHSSTGTGYMKPPKDVVTWVVEALKTPSDWDWETSLTWAIHKPTDMRLERSGFFNMALKFESGQLGGFNLFAPLAPWRWRVYRARRRAKSSMSAIRAQIFLGVK